MPVPNARKDLHEFAREYLDEQGLELDEQSANYLQQTVTLRLADPDPDTPRVVTIEQAPDGTLKGSHLSAYNYLELDLSDWLDLAKDVGAVIVAAPSGTPWKIGLTLIGLFNSLRKKAQRELSLLDTEILYTMASFGRGARFSQDEIRQAYQNRFGKELVPDVLDQSVVSFQNRNLLRFDRNNSLYLLRERVEVRSS